MLTLLEFRLVIVFANYYHTQILGCKIDLHDCVLLNDYTLTKILFLY